MRIFISEESQLPCVNVRFGSLADMSGCVKKRPLYP
jgi:hypothetical protein